MTDLSVLLDQLKEAAAAAETKGWGMVISNPAAVAALAEVAQAAETYWNDPQSHTCDAQIDALAHLRRVLAGEST